MSATEPRGIRAFAAGRHSTAVFLVGMLIAGFAWVLATPPGSAPDEQAHMIKALAIAHGQVMGTTGPLPAYTSYGGLTARQRQLLNWDTRYFRVDRGLVPPPPCYAAEAMARPCSPEPRSAWTNEPSYVGNFPPVAYLPMAVGARFGHSSFEATMLARTTNWLACWALLAIAVLALTSSVASPNTHLVALSLALTPSVWFVFGSANPSGIEISAAIALASGLTAVARNPRDAPRWLLASTSAAGGILACARPASWLWLLVIAGTAAILGGAAGLRQLRRLAPWGVLTLGGVGVAVWWQIASPSTPVKVPAMSLRTLTSTASALIHLQFPTQYVGAFQWLSVWSPRTFVISALIGSGMFLGTAAVRGSRRLARSTAVLAAIIVPATAAYSATIHESTGWEAAARYVFPATCCLFVLAGEALCRGKSMPRGAISTFIIVTVPIQLACYLVAAEAPATDRYHRPAVALGMMVLIWAVGWILQTASVVGRAQLPGRRHCVRDGAALSHLDGCVHTDSPDVGIASAAPV